MTAEHCNGVLCPGCGKWILLDITRRHDESASYEQARCGSCGRRYGIQVRWHPAPGVVGSIHAIEIRTQG